MIDSHPLSHFLSSISTYNNAATPNSAIPTAPPPTTSIFAPPVGDAVALAAPALALIDPDPDDAPEAAPPVALDALALIAASAAGSKVAVTPVPLLHALGITGVEDVKVMSAHCGWVER